ncbi:hypothetical protein ABZ626_28065 [Streptomyces longispororuber]
MSDAERLQREFASVIVGGHRHGGRLQIEERAAALSEQALRL